MVRKLVVEIGGNQCSQTHFIGRPGNLQEMAKRVREIHPVTYTRSSTCCGDYPFLPLTQG
jgi:hypothetical protein